MTTLFNYNSASKANYSIGKPILQQEILTIAFARRSSTYRAGKAYLEAQPVEDLDSALDCLKAHLQSTTHTKVKRNETDEKTI